jgi:hypothetical protein
MTCFILGLHWAQATQFELKLHACFMLATSPPQQCLFAMLLEVTVTPCNHSVLLGILIPFTLAHGIKVQQAVKILLPRLLCQKTGGREMIEMMASQQWRNV